MRSLLDVNVLIALHDADHVHHDRVAAWFLDHVGQGWASCPLTQNGALRVMSQAAYPGSLPLPALMRVFRPSFASPEHQFWPDDVGVTDSALFDETRIHGPRQLTDLYLLALAVRHGGRLVTLDSAIARQAVRAARPEHLLMLLA